MVFSAFVINIIVDGCMFSFGVIFVSLLEYFNKSKALTVLSGSILDSAPMLCGPIASIITNRFGYRKATILGGCVAFVGFFASSYANSLEVLCVTFGCIAGLGFSIPYLNSVVVVASYFESKNTLAIGISQSGAGLGVLIFAPLYEYLIETYGWRGAVMIISGIVLNTIPCGAMFRDVERFIDIEESDIIVDNTPDSIKTEKMTEADDLRLKKLFQQSEYGSSESEKSSPETFQKSFYSKYIPILKNKGFVLFMFAQFLVYFWYDIPYNFTVDRMHSYGVSVKKGSYIIAVIGGCHVAGNILFGFMGNRKEEFRYDMYYISLFLWGTTVGIIPLFTGFVPNIILAGSFGLISACQEAIHAAIIIDLLGPDLMTDAYGILMFIEGLANLSGPPVTGMVSDVTGNYDTSFVLGGCFIAFAGLVVFISKHCGKHKLYNISEVT